MCTWYCSAIVRGGLLPANASMGFANTSPEILARIDLERASREIPVYNTNTHEVNYGIDALLLIAGQKFKLIHTLGTKQPLYFVLQKLYALVSYNRRGMIAYMPKTNGISCAQPYSYNYKKFFIVLSYFLSFLCLTIVHGSTLSRISDWLYLLSGFVCLYAVITTSKKYLEFAMQWQLQCLIMVIMLIPFTLLLPRVSLAAVLYLGLVSILFIVQIRKRVKYLLRYQAD
jgi:hypothetical protein